MRGNKTQYVRPVRPMTEKKKREVMADTIVDAVVTGKNVTIPEQDMTEYIVREPDEMKAAAATKWGEIQALVLHRLAALIPDIASAREAAYVANIASDKFLDYTVGRRGAITFDNRSINVGEHVAPELQREILARALESINDNGTDQTG